MASAYSIESSPAEQLLESMLDTRRQLGFPADRTHVEKLRGSTADVGTTAIGLPLSQAELAEVERREAIYGMFQESMETEVRAQDGFAGIYIDHAAGGKVVVLTSGSAAALAERLDTAESALRNEVVIWTVRYSDAELQEAVGLLARQAGEVFPGIPLRHIAVDHENNGLVIAVPYGLEAEAERLAVDASPVIGGISIAVEGGDEGTGQVCTSRTNCYTPLKPGVRIANSSGYGCTLGFHIVLSTGGSNFLTSGHCTGAAWYHFSFGHVGNQVGTLYPSGGIDVKRVSEGANQRTDLVYGSVAGSSYVVSSAAWPVQFNTVRASLGRTNGVYTGMVTNAGGSYFLNDCSCWLLGARHNLSTQSGDSGSPIWNSSPQRAIGIHSSSGQWFAVVQSALDAWNADVA